MGQWEIHPWLPRRDTINWCRKNNVVVEAYSPLVQGTRASEHALVSLSQKHNKSWAQVLVRWSLQKVRYILSPYIVLRAQSNI